MGNTQTSTDGGKTFSAAAAINDGPNGQRFFTALATDSAGNLHASWFDTRNSAGNTALYDVYATFSKDGGLTFANNARVTAAPADAGTTSFIGDYSGIAAAGGYAHPVWTNGGGTAANYKPRRCSCHDSRDGLGKMTLPGAGRT